MLKLPEWIDERVLTSSADFEIITRNNGGVKCDYPGIVEDELRKSLNTELTLQTFD